MKKENNNNKVKLSQVLTSIFVLIGSFAVGVLGMLENLNLIVILPCFMISIFYSYISVKNIMEYKMAKKSN